MLRCLIHESHDLTSVRQHDLQIQRLNKGNTHFSSLRADGLAIIHSNGYRIRSRYKHYATKYLLPCESTQFYDLSREKRSCIHPSTHWFIHNVFQYQQTTLIQCEHFGMKCDCLYIIYLWWCVGIILSDCLSPLWWLRKCKYIS